MRQISIAFIGLCTCLALNLGWTPKVTGQVVVWKAGQKDFLRPQPAVPAAVVAPSPDTPSQDAVQTVELSPMAEPVPALKYRFWKTPESRQPGSVNEAISRASILYLTHPDRDALDEQYVKRADRWLESTTMEADLKKYLADQDEVLRAIYRAAELDTIELYSTVRELKGRAALGATFSEIQTLRSLARLVQLDACAAIYERRFDDAIRSISANFRLAEYAQKSGSATMLSGLVSLAISGLTFEAVDKLSQQPNAPNLYWAIASLPDDLWNLRRAFEGESQSIGRVLYPLLEPVAPTMKASDWEGRLLEAVETVAASEASPFDSPAVRSDEQATERTARLVVGAILLAFSDRAAEELIGSGYSPEQVQRMSAAERVARDVQLGLERERDELFKWTLMGSVGKPYSAKAWQRFGQRLGTSEFILPANVFLGLLLPALQAAEGAGLRGDTQRKQLLLREALRAHAATHDGKLPDSLVDLQPLPSLPNPSTGQLFEYQKLSDTEAIIRRQSFYQGDKSEIHIQLRTSEKKQEPED